MSRATTIAPWLWRTLLLVGLWLGCGAPAAHAHDVAGKLRLHAWARAQDGQLQVVLRVPLELLLNIDLPKRGNGYLDLARVDEALPRAVQAAAKDIAFLANGQRLEFRSWQARIALPSDRSFESFDRALASVRSQRLLPQTDVYWNQGYFDAVLEYPLAAESTDLAIDFHVAPGLRDRLRLDLRYITPAGEVRAFELVTGAGVVPLDPRWFQAAGTFVQSGLIHILSGTDHLLFLLCLVLPFARFGWPLVGVVTAFTVGHSLTLLGAALGWVPAAAAFPLLVEALIAASIVYMALENLLGPRLQGRWLLTAVFGLVHGFGFAFGLATELQFAGSHLVTSLLAFNVGIELGQLLVLTLAWPVLAWARARLGSRERWLTVVASAFAAHEAWHWLSDRFAQLALADWRELLDAFWPRGAAAVLLLVAALMALAAARSQRSAASTARASD